jgi:ABC-2 type transport system permease protein
MRALSIALKDLQILFKDRGTIIQLFLLPLGFIVAINAALGGFGAEQEDTLIPLAIVDLDGDETARALLEGIEAAGGVTVELHEPGAAQTLLDEEGIERLLTIPENFTEDFSQGRMVTLRLVSQDDADPEQTEAVRLVVEGVAQGMALESQILASLQQFGEMQANAPEEFQNAFSVEQIQTQAREQFEGSRTRPLISVKQRVPRQEAEQEQLPSMAEVAVPGFTVLFVFLVAQTTARSIHDEKKVGSFRRLLAAPLSKGSLLAGKLLPNFVTALIQIVVIFAFGNLGLGLLGFDPIPLGNDPLALILVAVVIALCSSALGIVIAAIARTESQIGGLSSLLLWGMGIIGGSIFPVFVLDRFLGPIPKLVPHYWANRALDNLMIRGLSLGDVSLEISVLAGFATLFIAIGLWRFDFD